jgi:hypothetical protein
MTGPCGGERGKRRPTQAERLGEDAEGEHAARSGAVTGWIVLGLRAEGEV